jgi:hypothetical protein
MNLSDLEERQLIHQLRQSLGTKRYVRSACRLTCILHNRGC